MNFSTYFSHKMLNWLRGTALGTAPTARVALFDGNPTSGGTEVTATIRPAGRLPLAFGAPANDTVGRTISQDGEVDFGLADAPATISHLALYDEVSAGNLLTSGAAAATRNVTAGKRVKVKQSFFNVQGDLVDSVKDAALNWLRGNSAATPPAATFLALYNGDPLAGGIEVTDTLGATRQPVTFAAPSNKVMASNVVADFGSSTSVAPVNVTHAAIFSAATGGTLLAGANVASAVVVENADEVLFESGDVTVSIL
jgi:hypothetical protein